MNGSLADNEALVRALVAGLATAGGCDAAVAVPAPYLAQVQALVQGSALALAAQDVSQHASGAFTGEVSAAMLREFGVRYVLVGHSERRQFHGETDADVAVKAQRALVSSRPPYCLVACLARARAPWPMRWSENCSIWAVQSMCWTDKTCVTS